MAAKSRYFNISQDYSCKHQKYGFNLLNMHRVHNILFSVKRSSFIIFCILRHYPGLFHLPCLFHYLLCPTSLFPSPSLSLFLLLSPVSSIFHCLLYYPLSPLLSHVFSIIPCLLHYTLSSPLSPVSFIIPCLLHYPLSSPLSSVSLIISWSSLSHFIPHLLSIFNMHFLQGQIKDKMLLWYLPFYGFIYYWHFSFTIN